MNKYFKFLILALIFFPFPVQAANSILDPLYLFMNIFYTNDPPTQELMYRYQKDNDPEYPFRNKLEEERGLIDYVRKFDTTFNASGNVDTEYLWQHIYKYKDRYPSLAAIWLRKKIGPCRKIEVINISLYVNGTLGLFDDGYHQPLRVTLKANGHIIKLHINWQTDLMREVHLDTLYIKSIDGESFYRAAVHDAETMCVKCWFE